MLKSIFSLILRLFPFLVGSMAQIGKYNTLEVTSIMDFGVYLDGENLEAILLPKTQVPPDTELGDWINVFIYLDSEDRLIATSLKPKAEVGMCAALEVKDVCRLPGRVFIFCCLMSLSLKNTSFDDLSSKLT